MGWLGKIIGGGVGFVVGGPIGAAVGASLGAIADGVADESPTASPTPNRGVSAHQADDDDDRDSADDDEPALEAEAEVTEDELGSFHAFVIHSPLPRDSFAIFTLHKKSGARVKAAQGYCDEDGNYLAVAPIADGCCYLYILHTALQMKRVKPLTLRLAVLSKSGEQTDLVGVESFVFHPTRLGPFSQVALLRPLIDVCMAVARADGQLDPTEVRLVKDIFTNELEIPPEELPALRDALKGPTVDDLEATVVKALLRVPGLTRADVLSFAARIAHADGQVSPAEVAVIRRIAGDVAAREWEGIVEELKLQTVDHHAVLGLAPGASAAEIKQAYRAKVTQYHPDRVSTLPPEFQRLAEQKTIELRAAYEALLKGA